MKMLARLGGALAATTLLPALASAQLHVGAMPTDAQLMFHMHAISGCVGNGGTIYSMLGKYEQNPKEWVVYYQYENPDGSRYFAYNVTIRQLDTGLWILNCVTQDGGSSGQIIEPLAAEIAPAPADIAPPPVEPAAEKPAPG